MYIYMYVFINVRIRLYMNVCSVCSVCMYKIDTNEIKVKSFKLVVGRFVVALSFLLFDDVLLGDGWSLGRLLLLSSL